MQRTLVNDLGMDRTSSDRTFIVLIALYGVLAAISIFLPQDILRPQYQPAKCRPLRQGGTHEYINIASAEQGR